MKGWKIAIAIFAGFFVLMGILSAIGSPVTEEPTKQKEQAIETVEESVEEIEDYTVEPKETDKAVVEIYNELELGMSEETVWDIAGEPDITSQTEDESLGTVLQLIYSDGHSLDNVTVMLDDGEVALIVLGEFNDNGGVDVKSKM